MKLSVLVQKRLAEAVAAHKECLAQHVMPDGRMRWEYYGVQRRVACAANNYGGYIVTGVRHCCPVMRMQFDAIGYENLVEFAGGHDKIEQGFIDQYGFFLTRREAYVIAKEAGQILSRHEWGEELYSESII